jgi:hypothetical protein
VLAEIATFPWDRVCIFGPYTANEDIDAATGIPGSSTRAFDIRSNDAIDVFLFIDDERIIASVAHDRRRGDFGPEVVRKCYSREDGIFVVRKPPADGRGDVGP